MTVISSELTDWTGNSPMTMLLSVQFRRTSQPVENPNGYGTVLMPHDRLQMRDDASATRSGRRKIARGRIRPALSMVMEECRRLRTKRRGLIRKMGFLDNFLFYVRIEVSGVNEIEL